MIHVKDKLQQSQYNNLFRAISKPIAKTPATTSSQSLFNILNITHITNWNMVLCV